MIGVNRTHAAREQRGEKMNIQVGLNRISAVFWGFWALFFAIWGLALIFINESSEWQLGLAALAALVPVYVAHRVTCWIVAGFFAPR